MSATAGSRIPEGVFGFVYTVTNLTSGRQYIGKKQLNSYRMIKEPGKLRRKKEIKESDWKKYKSSSKYLKADIKELGMENFNFVMEEFCYTRAELTYREVELQWQNDVLSRATLPCGERKWYNHAIGAIKFICPEFTADSTREKLKGINNGNFQGMVVAKCSVTGYEVGMFGNEDMKIHGFDPSHIAKVLKGKRKHHRGFTFQRRLEA